MATIVDSSNERVLTAYYVAKHVMIFISFSYDLVMFAGSMCDYWL